MKKVTAVLAVALITVLAISINSCKKKNVAPVIAIDEPGEGEDYYLSLNDSIHCMFTVTDDQSLHELSVLCIGPGSDTIFAEYPMVHDLKTYSFHGHPHPHVTGAFLVKVVAEDHDGGVSTDSRTVNVNP